jgi:hypothetical protein
MSSRSSLIAFLGPLLSDTAGLEGIRLIPSVRATDTISTPILIVRTDSFEKLTEAPRWTQGNFILALVSNHTDVDRAETQLDDLLQILLPTLLGAGVMWDRATQTQYDDQHIAYDITVRSILS